MGGIRCDPFNISKKKEKNFGRSFDKTMMCAENLYGNEGSCPGDSGGPFIVKLKDEDRFILAGTLHGGFEECSHKWPTIYTRIDDYSILKFIKKVVFNEDI